MKARILLVEDERNIALGVIYNLEKQGYKVEHLDRGDAALARASAEAFDLIILDVMLPGINGFDVCEAIRKKDIHTPILMLTARGETEHRIRGIRLGADDYLPKPFDLGELFARIEALLRRRKWDLNSPSHLDAVQISNIVFDPAQLTLTGRNKQIPLTSIETKLLQELVSANGRPLQRVELLERVWGFQKGTQTRTLDNFVMRLRNHFEELGGSAELIESVRGVGYRLKIQSAPSEVPTAPK